MRVVTGFGTARPNLLWQIDFTYLKVIGWCWFHLTAVLEDYGRPMIVWKICTTTKVGDVMDTLELALERSNPSSANVLHRPRLLSDNGSSYIFHVLAN